jgi:hypothetical protein
MNANSTAPNLWLTDPAWRTAWLELARRAYGFETPTARRLVFIRWLAECGRLSDW